MYYGWKLAWMLGLTQMVSWGILFYGFGVTLPHMQKEMGWTTAEASGAYSLAMLLNGFVAFQVGRWLDKSGPRLMMTVGSIAATLLVFAWANVQSLVGFYLVWAGIGLSMSAVLYEPAFWVVARWFARKRARALTIVTFWGGLASTVFIPLANGLIQAYGWRTALYVLAVILGASTILPHLLILRKNPADVGQSVDGDALITKSTEHAAKTTAAQPTISGLTSAEAMRQTNFWLLFIAFFLTNITAGAVAAHIISLALARGITASYAAWAAGFVGIMQVVGRLTLAPLGDRISRKLMTAFVIVLQMAGLALLLLIGSELGLILYVIFFGLGHGTLTPMRASLIADIFGVRSYGAINGAIGVGSTIARGIAPVTMGWLIMQSDSYSSMLVVLIVGSLIATFSVLGLDRRSRAKVATP
jgi:MFS family permease